MIGLRGRLTIVRHDEYGITDLRRKVPIKRTNLFREVKLRIRARVLTREYFGLKAKGMHSWEAYEEHRESIKRSFHTIHRALTRYKDRRIESGYFYICKHKNLQYSWVFVMSPLYYMPRKEALKRVRYLLQKRQAYARPSITADNLAALAGRRLTMKIWLIYLFVTIILACIILFY
ncbi:hypothetical protein BS78_06G236300 [Paspalum vaginatum]|nr:hypothetical protein BS78_06G236300 [Paspalum vaginatum]